MEGPCLPAQAPGYTQDINKANGSLAFLNVTFITSQEESVATLKLKK